jgi:hypothetical protein
VVGVTARNLSRDVDPGKPDQKAGRESRLARLSSRRGHESEGLRGSAIALRLPEGRSRPGNAEVIPKTARNSGGSAAGEAPTPQTSFLSGRRGARRAGSTSRGPELLRPRMAKASPDTDIWRLIPSPSSPSMAAGHLRAHRLRAPRAQRQGREGPGSPLHGVRDDTRKPETVTGGKGELANEKLPA